ncbi:DUF397 domain-containing protein [Streptomyces sp. NPDC006339]|uniref:DUF397 domain-containing protein n=1 Tax=Streptomyces sp. NPDC006339 TaxID=3156755 RepID=UPI0033BDF59A
MASKTGLNAPDLGPVQWRKSSYSGGGESQCVEIADVPSWGGFAVRDSKNPDGPAIVFDATAFTALITAIQDARFVI